VNLLKSTVCQSLPTGKFVFLSNGIASSGVLLISTNTVSVSWCPLNPRRGLSGLFPLIDRCSICLAIVFFFIAFLFFVIFILINSQKWSSFCPEVGANLSATRKEVPLVGIRGLDLEVGEIDTDDSYIAVRFTKSRANPNLFVRFFYMSVLPCACDLNLYPSISVAIA
jgi:hypothetical protein